MTLAGSSRTMSPNDDQVTSDKRPVRSTPAQSAGAAELSVRVSAGLHALAEIVLPFAAPIVYYNQIATFYETSGWLPYRTAPFEFHFVEHPEDRSKAHSRLCQYYEESVSQILQDIEIRIGSYSVDSEAVAVMKEATQAHRAQLYRCVCRVLLPEMERVIRTDLLHIKDLIPINEQSIRGRLKKQHLEDVVIDAPYDFVLFGVFHKHLFSRVKETRPENASVPNRHAGAHGWIAYSSMKEALNAIICADYVFRLVSSLKNPNSPATRA